MMRFDAFLNTLDDQHPQVFLKDVTANTQMSVALVFLGHMVCVVKARFPVVAYCRFSCRYTLTLGLYVTQRSSPRVSQEEERVRQVSGEPRGCAGKPEQNPHRGTQSPQRLVLPQIRVEKSPNACQVLDWCPSVQRLSTEPCIWMPLFLFYSCFLFKN